MEKGHPRYLTAVIKMPPETTSVGRCPPRIPLIHELPSCHDDIHAYAWVLAKVGVVRLSLFKHSREDPFRPINS